MMAGAVLAKTTPRGPPEPEAAEEREAEPAAV
jgi:hypothetical protein